jgi:hypothetical protein
MATYKVMDRTTKALVTIPTQAEAVQQQWFGHAVVDAAVTAGTPVQLDTSTSLELKLSDAHSLMGPTHRGKTWSGA